MSNTIVVLKGKSEISHELLKKTENKIFALDYNSHKILKKKSIKHELIDNELDENDLVKIFDKVVSLYDWYKFIPKEIECKINNFNFYQILDSAELDN